MPNASSSASQANDAPAQASAASRWPDEVWTTLLSMMSYSGLRTMERVSRKMKRLIESDKFDVALFRAPPTKKRLTSANKVTIHPMLDAVDCVNITTTSARILSYAAGDDGDDDSATKEFNTYDYPACDEFSTQPPCTQMLVNVNAGKPIPVTDRNGIKNRRIFKALGMFWQKKAPANLVHHAVEVKGVKASEAKMVDCLGEHCFFEGWESAKVQSDGTVHLDARWFGS